MMTTCNVCGSFVVFFVFDGDDYLERAVNTILNYFFFVQKKTSYGKWFRCN